MGLELLLARVQCYHLLDLLVEDQLGPQEWLEALRRKEQPAKWMDHTEKKTTSEEKDNEKRRDKEEVSVDLESRAASKPQPKPRRYHLNLNNDDQSVMELQETYSDLSFRGRPLVSEQLPRVHGAASSRKVAAVSKTDSIKGSKAAAPTLLSRDDLSKADKPVDASSTTSESTDENNERTTAPSNTSTSDENRVHELSGPQAISLYITQRTGPKEPRLKYEKTSSTEEFPARTQPQFEGENMRVAKQQEFQSLSSVEEEQELRELSEKMGHLCVRENKVDVKRTKENPKGEEREEQRQRERKNFERGAVKPNVRLQEMEGGEVFSHEPSRYTESSQPDWKLRREQKRVSAPTESSANCPSYKGPERDPTGQPEEKQVTLC
ncbi:uncharacterized protein LOC119407636 [Nematolebias whitei]|uniref:uncharacterized protein LOC119407636 n=1 Tax=Nematolebias whitei TaxID=451745 RepID=UPI00189A697F|nr:uncharacterized protein LOC119407636 [Nematolebias whitei]